MRCSAKQWSAGLSKCARQCSEELGRAVKNSAGYSSSKVKSDRAVQCRVMECSVLKNSGGQSKAIHVML